MPLLPNALRAGDAVAVIAPSGPVRDRDALAAGLARLESWGLRPETMPHCLNSHGYLAGTDRDRAADLQLAMEDPRIRGIFCARGGYGATRLLEHLDFTPMQKDPKPLIGYSDITALLAALLRSTGVTSFHGPMVAARIHEFDDRTEPLQCRLLFTDDKPVELTAAPESASLTHGIGEGPLVGGNLALVCSLLGTPWQLETRGRILFLEDIDEDPYRIDRMLTQLSQAGCFDDAAGVMFGDFRVRGAMPEEFTNVMRERLARFDIPVTTGWPFGHRPSVWTLPFGIRARLDASDERAQPTLRLLEPAVQRGDATPNR